MFKFVYCTYSQLSANFKIGYPSVIKGSLDEFSLPKGVTSTINGVFLFSIGGDFKYELNKNTTLTMGLNALFSKYNQSYYGFTLGSDFDPVTGITHKSVTRNHLNIGQINMPFIVKYFATPNISYNLGLVPQIIVSQKANSKIEYLDNWKSPINYGTVQYPLKKINPAIYIGMSFYKKLNSNILLEISPYAQINIIADDLYLYYAKNRLYQAGLSINVEKSKVKKNMLKKK